MNRMLKGMLCLGLLLSVASADAATTFGKTFFAHRSQGSNTARELVGWENHINRPDMDEFYGSFKITPEYTRSFDVDEIGKYLFFNGKNTMKFGMPAGDISPVLPATVGSEVNAWNWGVGGSTEDTNVTTPSGFESDVTIKPRVQNFIIDLGLFLGLDEWVEGLYFQVNLPLTWTQWKVNLEEIPLSDAVTFSKGVMDNTANPVTGATNIKTAWKGDTTFGNMQTKWEYGKIDDTTDNSRFRPADIEVIAGYNFINKEKGFLGLNLRFMAPTGNNVESKYVFEPMVGHDHWEFGAGLKGKAVLWDKEEDQELSFYLDGHVSHLFKKQQKRSYDFTANGKGSRYLLLKEFTAGTPYTYNGTMVNAINITTLDTDVKVDVKGDATAMFYYKNGGFSMDLGYNIWGRSKEKGELKQNITENKYGFFGVLPLLTGATLTSPTAGTVDGPTNIANGVLPTIQINGTWTAAPVAAAAATTISNADLDKDSCLSPSALSHKIFTNFQYNWWDNDYCPFLGIGGEVEFSGDDNHALDQWGVFLTGGFCY